MATPDVREAGSGDGGGSLGNLRFEWLRTRANLREHVADMRRNVAGAAPGVAEFMDGKPWKCGGLPKNLRDERNPISPVASKFAATLGFCAGWDPRSGNIHEGCCS